MTSTKGTTEMKTVVKYQKKSACALLMNQVNAAVIALRGIITEKTKDIKIMNKPALPLTPMLQKLKDNRKVAKEFYREYLKLCDKYNLEITLNEYGYTVIESVYLGNISVPTWTLLEEIKGTNDN